jgi:hypothetical protein
MLSEAKHLLFVHPGNSRFLASLGMTGGGMGRVFGVVFSNPGGSPSQTVAQNSPTDYFTPGSGFGLVAGADFKSDGGRPRVVRGGFDSHPFRFFSSERGDGEVTHERDHVSSCG